jgi:hypothetical protein
MIKSVKSCYCNTRRYEHLLNKIPSRKFSKLSTGNYADKEFSLVWPAAGYIFPGIEGLAVAIQDRVIRTKNYEKHCLGVRMISGAENVIKLAKQLKT